MRPLAPVPRPGSVGRTILAALSLLALAGAGDRAAAADDDYPAQFRPVLEIARAPGPIRIDGELDDPGWRRVAKATGFVETSPGDQVRPDVESEAWMTYDDRNVYVALIARDDPREVRVSVCDRDAIFRDDYFGLMIDTHGELSWGYELFVNPLGIQGDLRMLSSGGEDASFDIVWDSRGKLTDDGYQVEIAIPFESLRFPDRPEQEWRINFWRDRQRDVRRRYAWAAQDREESCFMCQWGTLRGIRDVRPGRSVEVITNVFGTQAGQLANRDDPGTGFDNAAPDAEASLNVRWALTSAASAELAINPDFSQVESDAGQIDVNSTFALFFPERRPFFQEGSDLYDTWIDAVYTRSINAPDVATKAVAEQGPWRMAYTFAHDDRSPIIVPFEERSEFLEAGDSWSNILRVRRSLSNGSYVGAVATDRRLDGGIGGAGSVLGLDSSLRVGKSLRLELQAVGSRTEEPDAPELSEDFDVDRFDDGRHTAAFDGETFTGHALYASLERNGRVWNADLDWWEFSPTFRTDNGFTTRNDYRQASLWFGPSWTPNRSWLVEWEPSVGLGRVWDFQDRFQDEWIRPNLWFQLRGQTNVTAQYLVSSERFAGEVFDGIRLLTLQTDARPAEGVGLGGHVTTGQGIYRDFDDAQLGDQTSWSAFVNWRPVRRVQTETDLEHARMTARDDDEVLFSGYIVRNRTTVNFTREWFLRLVVQYNDFSDRLDVEPLLTYRINPFTVFYVGTTSRYRLFRPDDYDSEDFEPPTVDDWKLSERQFFLKLQYMFRT